ncbi:hypothetical protein LOZ12_004242 [Ophidiomyces ophidiicola]|nr:hypothetical protein LOZ62_004168 [Ophidiomyces ophidiicola]KAI1960053.1 hypothetical protein LOZ59_002868 [Ophidiomyces ophidiicola]KAI1971070.1 hypothetical protein LOZ56_003267 [Ophidiomyces ophidiicola]KAI2026210.1 hypothetical protein LOZ48_005163 [Ophidiomyces ophidiicola]KAI2026776.1 hypothetical protein LOZ45_002840 [Ophidiomyces ophidiicola]
MDVSNIVLSARKRLQTAAFTVVSVFSVLRSILVWMELHLKLGEQYEGRRYIPESASTTKLNYASSIQLTFSSALLILSLVSFVPQYRRILSRGDSSGISIQYILFNAIVATEQFAFGLHFIVDNAEIGDTIVASPPTAGDWLNFLQFTVVCVCYLGLFILCFYYPSEQAGEKRTALTIYITFFLISVVPVIVESALPARRDDVEQDRRWFSAMFSGVHMIFVHPIVTLLGFASLFAQARETLSRSSPGALSPLGLAAQAVVFAAVALYWPFRMTIPEEFWRMSPWNRLVAWYQLVGWATVDNTIFALVQAILFWIATRRTGDNLGLTSDETAPLLHS